MQLGLCFVVGGRGGGGGVFWLLGVLFCFVSIHFGIFVDIILVQLIKCGPANSESLYVELLIQSHCKFPDPQALAIFQPPIQQSSLSLRCRRVL